VSGSALVESFTTWARGRPDLETDVVPTIVDLKAKHLDDRAPGRWQVGDLTELLLEIVPSTVLADEQWDAAVVPTMRAFLIYAAQHSLLERRSSALDDLLAELDQIAPQFDEVMRGAECSTLANEIMEEAGLDDEDEDSFDDELDEFDEFDEFDEDDWNGPRQLPAVRLAPHEDLVAAARASDVLDELDRLAARVIDRHQAPRAGDASSDEGRSRRLLALARRLELIAVGAGRPAPGPRLPELRALHATGPEADEQVLFLWVDAFVTLLDSSLGAGVDGEDDDSDPVVDVVGELVSHAAFSAYTGDPHSLELLLEETVRPQIKKGVLPPSAEEGVVGHLAGLLDVLADHGGIERLAPTERLLGDIRLTPLGIYGLREYAIDQGADAPVVGDVAGLPAAEALAQIGATSEEVALDLAREWFAARQRDAAVAEMLDVARTGTAATRELVLTVLNDVLEDEFDAELAPYGAEALLGPVLRGFIATRNAVLRELASLQGDLGQDPSFEAFVERLSRDDAEGLAALRSATGPLAWRTAHLPPGDEEVLLVETFARSLAGLEPPVRRDELDDDAWLAVDEAAVLRMAAAPHPELLFVLDAIGTGHPQGRVRKAAKKAAHKHRLAGGR
jgi:hypothetical protein